MSKNSIRKVLIDHDGGVDDFPALALLVAAPEVQVKAITYCEADSYLAPSLEATKKIVDLLGAQELVIAGSSFEGVNQFPEPWRQDSFEMAQLPAFQGLKSEPSNLVVAKTPSQVLVETLSTGEKYTLVTTGPLTNIAKALNLRPNIGKNIGHIFMMGGAIGVKGNVEQDGHDGSAEWNFYNDPPAADAVFRSDVDITMIGLDATNKVPLTESFLDQLKKCQGSPLGRLWFEAWSVAKKYIEEQLYYYWDTLTAAAVIEPELVTTEKKCVEIITKGLSQGRTVESPNGNWVEVAVEANQQEVEQFFLNRL